MKFVSRAFARSSYEKLPTTEQDADIDSRCSENLGSRAFVRKQHTLWWFCVLTALNMTICAIYTFLFLASASPNAILNGDLRKVSAFSPVLKSQSIPIIHQQISGKLFPANDGSDELGRAEPGPETDERWYDFEWQRMFAISSSDVLRLGKNISKTIKYPSEYGLGDDAYMASLDVFHQIHCLNMLRKEAFKDYYFDGRDYHEDMYGRYSSHERIHPEFFYIHLRHCTDILLQALTCNPNTDMITMTWMEEQQMPWPDFSINKKCMDFEALKRWRDENAQPVEKLSTIKKPFDQTLIDSQYWKIFGDGSHPGDNVHHPAWRARGKG